MKDKLDELLDSIPIPSHKKREIKKLFEESKPTQRKRKPKEAEE